MHINIPASILRLKGQCVNSINCDRTTNTITIKCRHDKRNKARDPVTGKRSTINCYVHRKIADLPILNHRVEIQIELAQVLTKDNDTRH